MAISVRRVDLQTESGELLAILQRNLPGLPHAHRFEWLYRRNPDGEAWSWFACEEGRVVGVASVFPRLMWLDGQLKLCGQVGDFAIDAGYRSLGPALLIQRATLEPVNEGILSFCFDCPPHDAGMAPFRRLGLEPNAAIWRYALPLRVENQMKRHFGFAPGVLCSAGAFVLGLYNGYGPRSSDLEISEHDRPFDDEFTNLDDSLKRNTEIRGRRSAAHLNWRYREDPLHSYKVLVARRRGELAGFLVFSANNENMTIVDVSGDPSATVPLLHKARTCCGPSCQSVEGFLSDQNHLAPEFLGARFRRRAVAAQVVAYAKPDGTTSAFLKRAPDWVFSGADVRA